MLRTAYSLTCAPFRTTNCTCLIRRSEMSGLSQRRKGARKREVRSLDIRSVEAMKISAIQAMAGSQYLSNGERPFTCRRKQGPSG